MTTPCLTFAGVPIHSQGRSTMGLACALLSRQEQRAPHARATPAPSACSNLLQLGLEGTLPSDGWDLPPQLMGLFLGSNRISGQLPEAWHLPAPLLHLVLYNNSIGGPIPQNFSASLPEGLRNLWLYDNALTGSIPSGWVLPNLDKVYLQDNLLEGLLGEGRGVLWHHSCPAAPWQQMPAGMHACSTLSDATAPLELLEPLLPLLQGRCLCGRHLGTLSSSSCLSRAGRACAARFVVGSRRDRYVSSCSLTLLCCSGLPFQ